MKPSSAPCDLALGDGLPTPANAANIDGAAISGVKNAIPGTR